MVANFGADGKSGIGDLNLRALAGRYEILLTLTVLQKRWPHLLHVPNHRQIPPLLASHETSI
jgi:hypothetical protein